MNAAAAGTSEDEPESGQTSQMAPEPLRAISTPAESGRATTRDANPQSPLNVRIELGRTRASLEDVLKLREGSVLPLDQRESEPVDVYVDGRLVARGDVVVLNDNYGIRVTELLRVVRTAA